MRKKFLNWLDEEIARCKVFAANARTLANERPLDKNSYQSLARVWSSRELTLIDVKTKFESLKSKKK